MVIPAEKLAKTSLSNIRPYIPGKPAEVLFREKGLSKIIKLASNENPLGPSPYAIKSIRKRLKSINRYPEGSAYLLKEKLASLMKINTDQIIVGSGSSEIISMVIQAFCEPGEEIIFPSPSFIMYEILAYAFGVRPVQVPLNQDMSYNLEGFLERINEKTKLLILCNPNNPTGSHIKRKQLERLFENIPERVVILCDEAYIEYVADPEFGSALTWLEKKHIIVTRTFSKIYGLAALRIGYGIASGEITGILEKIRPPFNTSSIAQESAMAALDDHDFVRKSYENNVKQKRFLEENLKKIGFEVFPSQANFLFCRYSNASKLCHKLEEAGIIVRPMKGFGLEDCFLRITIGKPSENRLLIKKLKEIIRGG